MTDMVERIARAIADGLGDSYDRALLHKPAWIGASGTDCNGNYRELNMPFKTDYIDAARAVLREMREPTDLMGCGLGKLEGYNPGSHRATQIWQAMIDAALTE